MSNRAPSSSRAPQGHQSTAVLGCSAGLQFLHSCMLAEVACICCSCNVGSTTQMLFDRMVGSPPKPWFLVRCVQFGVTREACANTLTNSQARDMRRLFGQKSPFLQSLQALADSCVRDDTESLKPATSRIARQNQKQNDRRRVCKCTRKPGSGRLPVLGELAERSTAPTYPVWAAKDRASFWWLQLIVDVELGLAWRHHDNLALMLTQYMRYKVHS